MMDRLEPVLSLSTCAATARTWAPSSSPRTSWRCACPPKTCSPSTSCSATSACRPRCRRGRAFHLGVSRRHCGFDLKPTRVPFRFQLNCQPSQLCLCPCNHFQVYIPHSMTSTESLEYAQVKLPHLDTCGLHRVEHLNSRVSGAGEWCAAPARRSTCCGGASACPPCCGAPSSSAAGPARCCHTPPGRRMPLNSRSEG